MLPEGLGVEAESSRKQHCRCWELCGTNFPVHNGSRKVREKESQKIWKRESNSNLTSTCSHLGEMSRGTLPWAAGMGHSDICLSKFFTRKLHLAHHPLLRTLFSDAPAGDKQLWQGQQLTPGPHFPESSPPFLPPTVSKGVAGGCPRNDAFDTKICVNCSNSPSWGTRVQALQETRSCPRTALVQEDPQPQHSLNGHLVPCSMTSVHTLVTQSKHTQQTQLCSTGSVPMDKPWGQDIAQGYQKVGVGLQEIQLWDL